MFFLFFVIFLFLGVISLLLALFVCFSESVVIEFLNPFFSFYDFDFVVCFDFVSLFFFSLVSLISSVVFLYSKFYMGIKEFEITDQARFLVMLFLFVFSMMMLVFSYSWFLVMVGWDGLGVVSFLLVIYYNDCKSLDSGLLTLFTNRLGDCFFLLSFIFMFYCGFFSFEYLGNMNTFLFSMIVGLGCITKSAQMPFSSWLPAAMAAPTPVSSLVHSSTLVTAGIYLLIRFNFLLYNFFFLLMVVSLLTMSIAGLFALVELDFKKVVAMSTLSQLGFMVFSLSMGYWGLSFLHMMFHALFKSVLFLSTGNIMHFIYGSQDSRSFGNFFNSFFSKLFFLMSGLSLMGFPFSLGFYSKDALLGLLLYGNGGIIVFFFLLSCSFTVAYSLRLMSLSFLGFSSFDTGSEFSEDYFFFVPVVFVFFLNVFVGNFFLYDMMDSLSMVFSYFELFIGVVVILLGVWMYVYISFSYYFFFFFSMMGFLTWLVTKMKDYFLKVLPMSEDLTWMEIVSSKGLNYMILSFYKVLNWFYLLTFFFMGLILLVFIMLF